jgi:superfamily II DNA or RNA helicase
MSIHDLMGTHLAHVDTPKIQVALFPDERARYDDLVADFSRLKHAIELKYGRVKWEALLRLMSKMEGGPRAIGDYNRAVALAAFPREKRRVARVLIEQHREQKILVFAARANDAYTIARDNLVPAITADIKRAEREKILASFREGRVRCIVSARVLNEGVDVPDANVAILLGGTLGVREQIQRMGRVLRPMPGKRAVVYDVFTKETIDERRSKNKWRKLDLERVS